MYSRKPRNPQHTKPSEPPGVSPENKNSSDDRLKHEENPGDLELPITLRKGVRSYTQHPISYFLGYSKLSPKFKLFTTNLDNIAIPRDIYHALQDDKWNAAVLEEMQALKKNGTWEVVDLPNGKNTVGSKWIFTIKYKANGSINRFKARLVAQEFTQTQGFDYEKTFAPVVKLNTIRVYYPWQPTSTGNYINWM